MPSKKDWSTYLISWKTKSDRQCTDPGQHESGVASGQGQFEFLIDNATAASHQAPPAASPDSPWTPSHQFGFSPGGPSTYVSQWSALGLPNARARQQLGSNNSPFDKKGGIAAWVFELTEHGHCCLKCCIFMHFPQHCVEMRSSKQRLDLTFLKILPPTWSSIIHFLSAKCRTTAWPRCATLPHGAWT